MSEIHEIFITPINKIFLNQDLNTIRSIIKDMETKYPSEKKSNVGGYQTPNIAFKKIKEFKPLIKDIEHYANLYSSKILRIKDKVKISNMWGNINYYKDFNRMHTHPWSYVSGVFYVSAPKDCGDLNFRSLQSIESYIPHKHRNFANCYNSEEFVFQVQNNNLFLFPPWTQHYVGPNFSDHERITIAFNLK